MMQYKGYIGHLVFDDEAEIFHGEIINTKDVITFQGKSVEEKKKDLKSLLMTILNSVQVVTKNQIHHFQVTFPFVLIQKYINKHML